ncbi:MAG: DUF4124 domain-containing protein [Burkholderiales bacterium]|nr:MAG: DUF4124 domain-containing protein [Burkholderiales bacterium]
MTLVLSGLVAVAMPALAQSAGQNRSGIYTCIDAKGRRITADRPIPECIDREQRELGSSGTVRRVVPPSYTAEERARIAAQRRAEDEARARVNEERRRERALLIRYPNQEAHDKDRALALGQVDEVVDAVKKRELELAAQRKEIDQELEFYQSDPTRIPAWLKRKLEDNEQQVLVQKRFLVEQDQEKRRINERFDEELAKLRQLWSQMAGSSR